MINKLKFYLSLITARCVYTGIKLLNRSSGTSFVGMIVLKICPDFLTHCSKYIKKRIVTITGTNGKSTTSGLIAHILETAHQNVIHNLKGANMLTGVANVFALSVSPLKRFDYAVIESDEAYLSKLYDFMKSDYLVVTNLFRDQLDRYGELIIGPQYTCCMSFSEGLAAVCLNGKWGYVDRAGKVKIPFDFVSAESFADGIAAAKLSGGTNRTIWLTDDGKRHETEQDAVAHRKAIMEEYLEMQKETYSEYRERKIKEMLKRSVSFREKTLQKNLKREFIKEKTKYKPDYKLGAYDLKNKEYIIFYDKTVISLHVQPRAAENFREQWVNIRKDTDWDIDNDRLTIDRIRFTLPDGTTYTYRKIN